MNGRTLMTACLCLSLPPSPRLWLGWAPGCSKEEPPGGVFVPLAPEMQRLPALPAVLHRPQPSNGRETKANLWAFSLDRSPHMDVLSDPSLRCPALAQEPPSASPSRTTVPAGGPSPSPGQEREERPIGGNWTASLLPSSALLFWACHIKNESGGGSLLPL